MNRNRHSVTLREWIKKKNSPVVQEEQVHSSSQAVRKPFSKGPEPIADYYKCGIGCLGAAHRHQAHFLNKKKFWKKQMNGFQKILMSAWDNNNIGKLGCANNSKHFSQDRRNIK